MFNTGIISVSQQEPLDCTEMAKFLSTVGIITSITPNVSVVAKTKIPSKYNLEYGCRLMGSIENKQKVQFIWDSLKNKYNFGCAHLIIPGKYDGCILNYLRDTLCKSES